MSDEKENETDAEPAEGTVEGVTDPVTGETRLETKGAPQTPPEPNRAQRRQMGLKGNKLAGRMAKKARRGR